MSDKVDEKIQKDGNAWVFVIISVSILLLITSKCGGIDEEISEPAKIENPK